MKTIMVEYCCNRKNSPERGCPFNLCSDNEAEWNCECDLNETVDINNFEAAIPDNCPLKSNPVKVGLL